MKTAILTVKVDPKIKEKAKHVFSELGLSMSSAINAFLCDTIRTRRVSFGSDSYEPSEYLIKALQDAQKDSKDGWVSPAFDNAEESLEWLNNPKRKYVRDLQ